MHGDRHSLLTSMRPVTGVLSRPILACQDQHVRLQAAGLAADNLMCALYFTTLFSLAKGIPPDPQAGAGEGAAADSALPGKPSVQV